MRARWSTAFDGQLVPSGFEACVRIFHPAYLHDRQVTWAEIAAHFETVAHPRMETEGVMHREPFDYRPEPGLFDQFPESGALPAALVGPVIEILAGHTGGAALCNFAFWEGYADLPAEIRAAPTFSLPGRTYHLLQGGLCDALGFRWTDDEGFSGFYRADLWWPTERGWFVGSDTDLVYTHVAGSHGLVTDFVASTALEAYEVSPETDFAHRGDDVNV